MGRPDYIELNRQFLKYDLDSVRKRAKGVLYGTPIDGRQYSWDQVLEHTVAVVLGEEGAGKTTELRALARRLVAAQTPAFFLPIATLLRDGVKDGLESTAARERFDQWCRGTGPAVFLLDSLDEAKLQRGDLARAWRRLERALGDNLRRSTLVLSCRVSDWNAVSDLAVLQDALKSENEGGDTAAAVGLFQLAALNEGQIRHLATYYGCSDVDGVLRDLKASEALYLLDRPLDVPTILRLWQESPGPKSYERVLDALIQDRLVDQRDGDNVPPSEARAALQPLMGLATLQNRWTFAVPDGALDTGAGEAVFLSAPYLTNTQNVKRGKLFRIGLFDEATYGRVRVHHRSVQEYLAAQWVRELCEKSGSPEIAKLLFFRRVGDLEVVPLQLHAVAAWTAIWVTGVRDALRKDHPEILLKHGDASSLPGSVRLDLLQCFLDTSRSTSQRYHAFSPATLTRLACAEIEPLVHRTLLDPATEHHTALLLVRLVESGRISGCFGTLAEIATDPRFEEDLRATAFHGLLRVDGSRATTCMELLRRNGTLVPEITAHYLESEYPSSCTASDVLSFLESTPLPCRNFTSRLDYVLRRLVMELNERQLVELLIACESKLPSSPWAQPATACGKYVLALICDVVLRLLETCRSNDTFDCVARVINYFGKYGWLCERGGRSFVELRQLVETNLKLRHRLFWWAMHTYLDAHRRHPRSVGQFAPNLVLPFVLRFGEPGDETWLIEDAMTRGHPAERALAVHAAVGMHADDGVAAHRLERFQELAASHPVWARRLARHARKRVTPPPLSERRWRRRFEAARARELGSTVDEEAFILAHRESIRAGERPRISWHLYAKYLERGSQSRDLDVASVQLALGDELGEIAFAGWVRTWRKHPCPHRFEEPATSTPGITSLALIGVGAELTQAAALSAWTDDDARLATRLATWSDSTPAWLDDVWRRFPVVVVAELRTAMAGSLAAASTRRRTDRFVQNCFTDRPLWFWVVMDVVLDWLETLPVVEPDDLLAAVATVLQYCVDGGASVGLAIRTYLCALSESACEQTASPTFGVWWRTLFELNPTHALKVLDVATLSNEALLAAVMPLVTVEEGDGGLALRRCTKLLTRAEDLATLFRVLCVASPPVEEERVRSGTTYVVETKHRVEFLRSRVLSALCGSDGSDVATLLWTLSQDPVCGTSRDYLAYCAKDRAERDATTSSCEAEVAIARIYQRYGTAAIERLNELNVGVAMGRIDVAVLTMKPEEFDAVLGVLGETQVSSRKRRDYDTALLATAEGDCRVAVTRLVHQGNLSAQEAVAQTVSDLHPRWIVVVGIAGTVPHEDYCLGDVIVSSYIYDLTLEDTGANGEAPRYSVSGGPLHPDADRVVARLGALVRGRESWCSPESIKMERPPVPTAEEVALSKHFAEIERRISANRTRSKPLARDGRIASSDRLLKDFEITQVWQQTMKGIAAIEMESAGAHRACQSRNVPFLAIRGISDIVGVKRDERWTKYACHTSAAYLRMLIEAGVFAARGER